MFNGGSDFNEPVKRCMERLTDARWANADILLVSDGELRQPAQEVRGAARLGDGKRGDVAAPAAASARAPAPLASGSLPRRSQLRCPCLHHLPQSHRPATATHPARPRAAAQVMRKLAGAKEKLGLRVHGLVIAAPDKKRADPAVLRGLCTNYLPNGKTELLVSEFNNWASVQVGPPRKGAVGMTLPAVPQRPRAGDLWARLGSPAGRGLPDLHPWAWAHSPRQQRPRSSTPKRLPPARRCPHPLAHSAPSHPNAQADQAFALDWDDVEGNSKRRLAGLALEARRAAESRRLKAEMKARGEKPASLGPSKKH